MSARLSKMRGHDSTKNCSILTLGPVGCPAKIIGGTGRFANTTGTLEHIVTGRSSRFFRSEWRQKGDAVDTRREFVQGDAHNRIPRQSPKGDEHETSNQA